MNLKEFMAEAIDGEQTGIRFLHFRTDRLSPQKAQKVVSAIGEYNGFKPEKVNEALDLIAGKFGKLGIEVSREFSPCLYLSVHLFDDKTKQAIREMLAAAGPDELGSVGWDDKPCLDGPRIRAWWD